MMMNDSISVSSSSYSSSSQSSSLNRSSNGSYLMNTASSSSTSAVTDSSNHHHEQQNSILRHLDHDHHHHDMNARDSSGGLGVSSSSGGASPVLLVRHRQRRQHRPRAKSQTQLSPNVNYFDDRAGSRLSAGGDSSAASTRPVSLNNDEHTSAAAVINASLIEHNKQLMEDLFELKRQLKLKDDEIEKLVGVRNQLDSEMQELSASLFEQAYNMVNSARAEAAQSEKLLKEANGKIDVLQAEVKALKELVLNTSNYNNNNNNSSGSSTPSRGTQRLGIIKPTSSHSRQSSLNQQTMATAVNLIPVPSSTSTPSNHHNTVNVMMHLAASTNNLSSSSGHQRGTTSSVVRLSTSSSSNSQTLSGSLGKSSQQQQQQFLQQPKESKHKRLPSDQAKSFIDKLFHTSTSSLNSSSGSQKLEKRLSKNESLERTGSIDVNVYEQEAVEHDATYYDELVEWRQQPVLTANTSPFLDRIYTEDILPCLSFNNNSNTLNDELLKSIQQNSVCIEDISNSILQSGSIDQSLNKVCGLSNAPCICQYKIKLNENGPWIYISRLTRNRIISVCDFFTYLRYIKDGLVKSDVNEIYWSIIDLRRKMALSRLGL